MTQKIFPEYLSLHSQNSSLVLELPAGEAPIYVGFGNLAAEVDKNLYAAVAAQAHAVQCVQHQVGGQGFKRVKGSARGAVHAPIVLCGLALLVEWLSPVVPGHHRTSAVPRGQRQNRSSPPLALRLSRCYL